MSREARVARQRELLEANPGLSLLSLTAQPPGPVKRTAESLVVAEAGVKAVRAAFQIEYEELRDLETGYEGFFLVPESPEEAKRLTCRIEDTHPLGRLMDIDVIVPIGQTVEHAVGTAVDRLSGQQLEPGRVHSRFAHSLRSGLAAAEYGLSSTAALTNVQPLGREEIGLEPRRCLLCDRPARECMRAKTHALEELLEKYKEIVNIYLKA